MDVSEWLRSLGLGQYDTTFRDNGIEADVLFELTEADFEKLGVLLGHRRRLIKAIATVKSAAAEPAQGQPAAEPAPKPQDVAERRQLTVMFCDLVGSTAMSARLDPEDMRGIIGPYHQCCASLIERNGGFVAKYMGDGVLAYFGYPQAHEHDAERAVRAGLAIVEAAPKLQTVAGEPLHVRVGIATGIVVVGDLSGSGGAQERGVVGDTPNLAARLQGIAQPDSVVIGEGTRRLLGALFEIVDLGSQDLKGVTGPTRAYAALRESALESRFDALHAGGLTPLVGREEESELLLRRWAKAKAGEGQVVLLSGEAGIGKSRLAAAFVERLAGEPHVRLRYFCSPQHTDSALYPIIGHMSRAAALTREDDVKTRLDKLDALLAQSVTSLEDAALLAEMLSLRNDGRYPVRELTPPQRRQKTMEALIGQVAAISRQAPVLMILEDAHWADPSSLEVFSRVVDKIETLPVLLFVTFRPEFATPWIGHPHVTAITVNRLSRHDVEALIDCVVGNKPLPADIRQDIVERADGIPLFVEEMTKAVLEGEGEGAARTIAAVPPPALTVPASLHASLMARLDRLGEAKAVAQIAAALGREFSRALLAPVAGLPDLELNFWLDRLVHAGLLSRQGVPPHSTYLFKHALVQDAAYGTLLRDPRRALHTRIAEVLESQFPDIAGSQPELVARHCAEAGLVEMATSLWGKAGQLSVERSALVEAVEQFARALGLIATLPATPARRRDQIKLQVAIITPLIHVKGYAAPETREAVERARQLVEKAEVLGEPAGDPLLIFVVLYGVWTATFITFDGNRSRQLAVQFLELAEQQEAAVPIIVGHRLLGLSLFITGNLAEGRAHLNRAIELYDPAQHRPLAMRFGQDARTTALSYRSWALWLLGYPAAALADVEHAAREAREIGHVASLMHNLTVTSVIYILCGRYAAANALCDELVPLEEEKGALMWKAWTMLNRGCVLAVTGNAADAIAVITSEISAFRSTRATINSPLYLSYLATAHSELDQFNDAWRCIDEATTLAETTGERWFDAEISRLSGEIELLSPERNAVKTQAYFKRALEIARAQQARSWELRAATSLARLWCDQRERQQAHDLLAPVYSWFTEGFDTRDLKEAKALLEELA